MRWTRPETCLCPCHAQDESGGSGWLGDIYDASAVDWSPAGLLSNPYVAAIRSGQRIAQWQSEGLSAEQIEDRLRQDEVLGSYLGVADRNEIVALIDRGVTGDDVLVAAVGAVFKKAISGDYAAKPKLPSKLEPFSNPHQSPVIPKGWLSRPGRTQGSVIYYPPGTNPRDSESTYIRVMPAGSTPIPGLENGYWTSVVGGQPVNIKTGKRGSKGETHVPLPFDGFSTIK